MRIEKRKLVRPAGAVSPKVSSAGLTAALATIVEWVASGSFDWQVALVAAVTVGVAYLKTDAV